MGRRSMVGNFVDRPAVAILKSNNVARPATTRCLLVCIGPCCDRFGHASANLTALHQLLLDRGWTDSGIGSASCVRRSCLGKCSGEPLAHVLPDDIWYRDLSAENLLRIYEQHVLNRQPVVDLALYEDH